MKQTLMLSLMISIILGACQKDTCPNPPENYVVYSDYFVFVADDGGSRLVIPMDMNWVPNDNGYEKEFKSWEGTAAAWPINYLKENISSTACEVPQESWEHSNDANFQFDAASRKITSTINSSIEVGFTVPDAANWVQLPNPSSYKTIYGFKTTATVDGQSRTGWMIYERIRREAAAGNFGDFGAFYWMPIVANGNFYYFQDHDGVQEACRWTDNNGTITVDVLSSFSLNILATAPDATSGRNNVVSQLQVVVPQWNVDFTLNSTGHQIGYGGMFPNGLALYRQSLLEPTTNSVTNGYGMLELILEND